MITKEEIKKQCPEFEDYIDYCFETLRNQYENKKVIEVFNTLAKTRQEIGKLLSNNEYARTEAALCIWEYVITNEELFRKTLKRYGYVETRYRARNKKLTDAVCEAIQKAQESGYGECYDWHFVPWFIENLTDEELNLVDNWENEFDELLKNGALENER